MIELFEHPSYDFIGRRRWAYAVSAAAMLIALVALGVLGLRYDVDFTGGTLIQVRFAAPVDGASLRAALATTGLGDSVIQALGDSREYVVRTAGGLAGTGEIAARVEAALRGQPALGAFDIRRVEFVGPQVGRDLQMQAVYAVVAAVIGILVYIGLRFDLKGGVAAVVAIVHDVTVCLGALALTQREFSLPVLAALLTIVGYSVNDTIVAYDRVRENRNRRTATAKPFAVQINEAINQTLSRTVLTALTTFFASVVLFLFGGATLEGFAFVLTVGIVSGTYSTVYIAAAIVVDWTRYVERPERAGRPRPGTA
jgi:preprotein translocase subunit SecF